MRLKQTHLHTQTDILRRAFTCKRAYLCPIRTKARLVVNDINDPVITIVF